MKRLIAFVCLASAAAVGLPQVSSTALAQPTNEARAKAQSLNKEGVGFLSKKDWANAVNRFQRAYAIYPSPKVLLNIAAALRQQGRAADAANTYQRYLNDPGSTANRRQQVAQILTQTDPKLGVVTIKVSEAGAELQVAGWVPPWRVPGSDVPWLPARKLSKLRFAPGSYTVRARKDGFKVARATGVVSAGQTRAVSLTLELAPVETKPEPVAPTPVTTVPADDDDDDDGVTEVVAPERGLQLGALIDVAIDGKGEGFAVSPGVSLGLNERLELFGKALIGGSAGGYVGASYYLMTGRLRPRLSAGLPFFVSDGLRAGLRGGAGVAFGVTDSIAAVGEIGGEYFFNPEMNRVSFVLVPIIGVHARL